MLMLPVPAFVALILSYLALRTWLLGGRRLLAAFLAACAVQSLGVALAQCYGITALQTVLPITAACLPPLAWISFRASLFRAVVWREALPHLAAPLFCLFCRIFAPQTLDIVVAAMFAGYGAAILASLRQAKDLPLARIAAGGVPATIWRALGWLLIVSACADVLIALAFAAGQPLWAHRVISLFASGSILCLGVLGSLPDAAGAAEPALPAAPDADALVEDQDIVLRLDGLLQRDKAYLDPDLSILRLARRLHLPEKRISAAVNRATGGNVSRYINAWRIEHACRLLREGQSVTEAMLGSGFNTKSNFNREFARVTQLSPSLWLKQNGSVAGASAQI
ncbi:MAG: AraC family transcriptional regulator [Cypionkella sp.]|uniref:helix-turn-helix domain-containing protein n=1 Tax=Cypionkella sp. TaxID=2811411 RepID=UPI002ABC00CB|nr:AraC family transcriptional regulator [Cypionkella sp.]MDZ4311396.1 AraC family transcriptional regulator [Cypionkella sp.]